MSKSFECVTPWFEKNDARLHGIKEKIALVNGAVIVTDEARTVKKNDIRLIVHVTGSRDVALKDLERATNLDWHFLGYLKEKDQLSTKVIAKTLSRNSKREYDDLLVEWEKERARLMIELKDAYDQADTLSESEARVRKEMISLQRNLEAEVHILKKEKSVWERERQEMLSKIEQLSRRLDELRATTPSPGIVCATCQTKQPSANFSIAQRKKRVEQRKCQACVAKQ